VYTASDWPRQYAAARQGRDVQPFWDKFQAALSRAGIQAPRARVLNADGSPARRTEIRYFSLGKIRYHVVSAEVPGKYIFASAAPGHAYDMRGGEYGGAEGRIPVAINTAFPALVALSPGKISGVTARALQSAIAAGERVTISAQVQTERPDVHALHFRVYGPDGVERRWYGDTLFGERGKAELTIPTARNEARGKWTVKISDLASGANAEAAFEVK